MSYHSIGVSSEAYLRLQQVIQDLALQGRNYSQSRTMHYLANFERTIREGALRIYDLPEEEKAKAFHELFDLAWSYVPPVCARGIYRRSRKVAIDDRLEWMYAFVSRLDVADPPKYLVDAAIDTGRVNHPAQEHRMRVAVLERTQLRKAGLPEATVAYLVMARLEKEFRCGKGKDLTEEQLVAIQNEAKAKVQPPTQ